MFSVVILTRNEAQNIGACIDSLHWCDDIHIIDSGSTDNTVAIAKHKGAQVHVNRFTSFAMQRNWALEHCNLKYEWILHMDADERSTDDFYDAMLTAIQNADRRTSGFYCCWKTMLNNKWLYFSDRFPQWQFRISRRTKACFIDYGDAQKDSQFNDDQLGYIDEPFEHLAFSKGWSYWLKKQSKYALLKAKERVETKVSWKDFFVKSMSKRNHNIKILLSRSMLWPLIRFGYIYFLRLGFLDGKAGLVYCIEKAHQEFVIQLMMRELTTRPTQQVVAIRASKITKKEGQQVRTSVSDGVSSLR